MVSCVTAVAWCGDQVTSRSRSINTRAPDPVGNRAGVAICQVLRAASRWRGIAREEYSVHSLSTASSLVRALLLSSFPDCPQLCPQLCTSGTACLHRPSTGIHRGVWTTGFPSGSAAGYRRGWCQQWSRWSCPTAELRCPRPVGSRRGGHPLSEVEPNVGAMAGIRDRNGTKERVSA